MNLVQIVQQCRLRYFGHVFHWFKKIPLCSTAWKNTRSATNRWTKEAMEDCTEQGMSLVDATHLAMDRGH